MTCEVIADREQAKAFVNEYIQVSCTEHYKGLCLVKDGDTIASVIYDEFNGTNILTHIAAQPGKKWLNRWFLHEMFKYPFVTLGAKRITCPVSSDNKASLRFVEHLGFRREAVLERAGRDGQDVHLLVMFREDCRYA